jgi:hypothetical protein
LELHYVHWCQYVWAHPAEVGVRFYRFVPHVPYTFTVVLEKLSLHSLRKLRHALYALFLFHVYRGLKSCASLLEIVNLRVPPGNLRDFSLFVVCPSNKHCPSARWAYAAIAVGIDLDIFAIGALSLNHIYTHQPKIVNIICSRSWCSVLCNSCYLSSLFVSLFVCLLLSINVFSSSNFL